MDNDNSAGPPKVAHKFAIQLTDEQVGPFPIDVEWLWFDEENGNFRLKNIPFFVDEVSYDDVVSLAAIESGLYKIDRVIEPSGNSTVWLLIKDELEGEKLLEAISKLGCGVEGGVSHGYYAVNIPTKVNFNEVMNLLTPAEDEGAISTDYPSIRHCSS